MKQGQPFTVPDPESIPLRRYHLPDPVSWWPPAPGWWFLAIGIVAMTAMAILYTVHRKRQLWKKQSQQELTKIESRFTKDSDCHALAKNLSVFLRRVCLSRFPSHPGTNLTGEDWLIFLDSCTSANTNFFHTKIGSQFLAAAYNPHAPVDGEQLVKTCRQWLASLPSQSWRSHV